MAMPIATYSMYVDLLPPNVGSTPGLTIRPTK